MSECYQVKVWSLPEGGLQENLTNPTVTFASEERKIENVLWHPTAENVLTASVFKTVKIYDVAVSQEKIGKVL